jgi:serine/threonine protein kinase/tetratricopeptide (TPR) repeat protein
MQINVGNVIDGRYEIVSSIASGGFAVVYKAFQQQFDRFVALKVLDPFVLHDADSLPRFEREAKALSALRHKNVVALYAYGVSEQAPYMVMELVDGISLQKLIRQEKIEARRAAELMLQVCEGLECAHNTGLVHRDLKPSNIMVCAGPDGKDMVKIIDFGLAKLLPGHGLSAQKLTETGITVGTCAYMAPEQCTGINVDHRTDIYAAGCILYECVAGTTPFVADDNVSLMVLHINEEPKPLSGSGSNDAFIYSLDHIVRKSMAKNPEERYHSIGAMKEDLRSALAGKTPTNVGQLPARKSTRPKASLRTALIALVGVLTVLLAVTASFLPSRKNSAAPGEQPQPTSADLFRETIHGAASQSVDRDRFRELLVRTLNRSREDNLLDPQKRIQVLRALATEYARINNLPTALEYHNEASALMHATSPDGPDAWLDNVYSAHLLRSQGRTSEAKQQLDEIIYSTKKDYGPNAKGQARLELAMVYQQMGEKQLALRELDRALKTEGTANQMVGELLYAKGNMMLGTKPREAQDILEDAAAIAEAERPSRMWCGFARALLVNGDYARAYEVSEKITPTQCAADVFEYRDALFVKIAATAATGHSATAESLADALCNSSHQYENTQSAKTDGAICLRVLRKLHLDKLAARVEERMRQDNLL